MCFWVLGAYTCEWGGLGSRVEEVHGWEGSRVFSQDWLTSLEMEAETMIFPSKHKGRWDFKTACIESILCFKLNY